MHTFDIFSPFFDQKATKKHSFRSAKQHYWQKSLLFFKQKLHHAINAKDIFTRM